MVTTRSSRRPYPTKVPFTTTSIRKKAVTKVLPKISTHSKRHEKKDLENTNSIATQESNAQIDTTSLDNGSSGKLANLGELINSFDSEVTVRCGIMKNKIKKCETELCQIFALELVKIPRVIKNMTLFEFVVKCRELGVYIDSLNIPSSAWSSFDSLLESKKTKLFEAENFKENFKTVVETNTPFKPLNSSTLLATQRRPRGLLTCAKSQPYSSRSPFTPLVGKPTKEGLADLNESAFSIFMEGESSSFKGIAVPLESGDKPYDSEPIEPLQDLLINEDTDFSKVAQGIGKEALQKTVQRLLDMKEQVSKLVMQIQSEASSVLS